MTASDPASDPDAVEPSRPARPVMVETAAAILIVGGGMGFIMGIASLANTPPGTEAFAAGSIALAVASIIIGALVRLGRAWLLALNVAAVLGFLDLLGSGGSPLLLMLGLAEILVVVILLTRKPWFDAMGRWRAEPAGRDSRRRVSP